MTAWATRRATKRGVAPAALAVALVCAAATPLLTQYALDVHLLAYLAIAATATAVFGRGRLAVALSCAWFVAVVHVAYVSFIPGAYGYQGLVYVTEDGLSALALALAWVPALWLPVTLDRPSATLTWVLYVIGYVPSILVPAYVSGPMNVLPLTLLVAAGFSVITLSTLLLPNVSVRTPQLNETAYMRLAAAIAAVVTAYLLLVFGVTTDLPALDAVYERRAEYRSELAVLGQVSPYVVQWAGHVCYPLLIVLGLYRARPAFAIAGLLGAVYVYAITGFKSVILVILLVAAIHVVAKWQARRFGVVAAAAPAAVTASAALSAQGIAVGFVFGLFVYRLLVLPGALTAFYFEFFSHNATYELRHSVLGFLGPAPYELTPASLIGLEYFGDAAINANANVWADGMANFGLWGIGAASLLLAVLVWWIDRALKTRPILLVGPLTAILAFEFSQTGLLTALMTGGGLLAIAVLFLSPQEDPAREVGRPKT